MKPGIIVEVLALIALTALLWAQLAAAQPQEVQQLLVSLEFHSETPLPPGFTPLSLSYVQGLGIAVLGVSEVGVSLLYYDEEGVLQWSTILDGIEPVAAFISDDFIHAVVRHRVGTAEYVTYYRLTLDGEVVQEFESEVGRAALVYYAVKTDLGVMLVGVEHGGSTGWDPMAALLVPGTGVAWKAKASHPGDQEPLKPSESPGAEQCILYSTRGVDEALLICLDKATGTLMRVSTVQVEGAISKPVVLASGSCIAYPVEEGVRFKAVPSGAGVTLSVERPDKILDAVEAEAGGYRIAVLLGVRQGEPWAGLAVLDDNGCPGGGIVSGAIGAAGLVPVAAEAHGDLVAVAFASAQGAPLLAVGKVSLAGAAGLGETSLDADNLAGQDQSSGRESGWASLLLSPMLTAALLAALLVLIVVAVKWRRAGRPAGSA